MWYVDYNVEGKDGDDTVICPDWIAVVKVVSRNENEECDIRRVR